MCDYIELEAARYSSIKKIQLMAEAYSKKEDVLKLLEKTEATVTETQDQAKNLSQQLVSILGGFAGIIILSRLLPRLLVKQLPTWRKVMLCILVL